MRAMRYAMVVAMLTSFLAVVAGPALAHERRVDQAGHEFVVGWLEEPAFAGFKNAVQFIASHGDGDPITEAQLQVEVAFGAADADEVTDPMPLEAAFGTPGEYHAFLIPTRPGTYSFHVFGTLEAGEEIDETFTSGPDTFNDILEPAEVQFPAQDPSTGELAEAVSRLQTRVESAQDNASAVSQELAAARSDAEGANDAASLARLLAILALGVAVVAIVAAVLIERRRRAAPA